MNSDVVIKKICHSLELLLSEGKLEGKQSKSVSKDEALMLNLKQNIKDVIQVISNDSSLCNLLSSYGYSELLKSDHVYWDFVSLCLVLLKALCETLLLQEKEGGSASQKNEPPKGILSLSQERTVKRCLQFIIALGVMPNLIPSIKEVFKKRTSAIAIIQNLDVESCLKKKYYQIICCLLILIDCLQQQYLQEIILTNHGGDLLITLFQICYAPIKKIEDPVILQQDQVTDNTTSNLKTPVNEILLDGNNSFDAFSKIMLKIKESRVPSDTAFIGEMLADRKHFTLVLHQLLKQICPSILLWELLLLQGTSLKSAQSTSKSRMKLPVWFRKICNQILTEKIMAPSGIETFIRVALDKMCDADVTTGTVNKEKIDAIAKLIVMNRVTHLPTELYVKHISIQILDLFRIKGTPMDQIFTYIASSVMLHLIELNCRLADYHIFNVIFKPFLGIFDSIDQEVLIAEDDITQCIEHAYQIFVLTTSILSPEAIKILLPFYHLLFIMYVKLVNGVLFLKTRVEDLLLAILNNSDEDDAILLLHLATFNDVSIPIVQSAAHLKCVLGRNGGIQIIRKDQSSPEDVLEDINDKCQALLCLINKISDKKLKVSFFLSLLKRLTSVENDRRHSSIQNDDVSVFFDHLIYLHLLEELSKELGDDLIHDADKAIELISAVLSCSVIDDMDDENTQISEEKLLTVLPILSTIIGYKEQLTYKHWNNLKMCLPSLEKLVASAKEPYVKDMACGITVAIKTHGAIYNCPNDREHNVNTDNDYSHMDKVSKMSSQLFTSMHFGNGSAENATPVEANGLNNFFQSSSNFVYEKHVPSSSRFRPFIEEIPCPEDYQTSAKESPYVSALNDVNDSCLPTRGHGLLSLCKLIETGDGEAFLHRAHVLLIFQQNLSDDESYIYLSAIRGLSAVADVDAEIVFPILLSEMENFKDEKLDLVLKIGEVLLKICQNLGELTVKYRDILLNLFLRGTLHQDSHVRASSLSNLGEVCKKLRFSIGSSLQEVLLCVKSLLKTDPDIVVRRSAILVLRLLLQGTGKDTFKILESDIKDLYSLLRQTYQIERDDILKLHCQLAIQEVDIIVKDALKRPPQLIKEIRVCDSF